MTATQGAAFVTGSSRGIGRAIALSLAEQGFDVAVNGHDSGPDLDASVEAIKAVGVRVCKVVADISDVSQHASIIERVAGELGDINCLVNNAGVSVLHRGDLLDVSVESYDRCMAVNAKAVFFLSQAFARHVLAAERRSDRHYSLINITSSNAVAASITRAEYCASKAAAAMISRVLSVRLANEGIQVFDVQPGLIETDMSRPAKELYERRINEEGLTLIKRMGQPDDIGRLVVTLATGGLPYTAGQAISADAGMLVPRF